MRKAQNGGFECCWRYRFRSFLILPQIQYERKIPKTKEALLLFYHKFSMRGKSQKQKPLPCPPPVAARGRTTAACCDFFHEFSRTRLGFFHSIRFDGWICDWGGAPIIFLFLFKKRGMKGSSRSVVASSIVNDGGDAIVEALSELAQLYLKPCYNNVRLISGECGDDDDEKVNADGGSHLERIKSVNARICALEEASVNAAQICVCYESDDGSVVAAHKPSGVSSGEAKLAMMSQRPKWRNIHRIDKSVSGCLVGSSRPRMRSQLQQSIRERACLKCYCALIPCRRFDETSMQVKKLTLRPGTFQFIDIPLMCKEFKKKRMLPCATFVRSIWSNGTIQCVLAFPITGRYHQIRRHLAAVGAEILSVGIKGSGRSKIYLHACRYDFPKHGIVVHSLLPPWMSSIPAIDTHIDTFLNEANCAKAQYLRNHASLVG